MKKYSSEAYSSNSRTLHRYVVVAGLVLSVGLTIAPGAVSTAYADELASGSDSPAAIEAAMQPGEGASSSSVNAAPQAEGKAAASSAESTSGVGARICLNLTRLNRAPVKRALLVPANSARPLLVKALLLPRLPQRAAAHLQPRPHRKAVLRLTLQPQQQAMPPTQPLLLPLPLAA